MPNVVCPECDRGYSVGWRSDGTAVRCECGARFPVSLRSAYRDLALRVALAVPAGLAGVAAGWTAWAATQAGRAGAPAWAASVLLGAGGLLAGAAAPSASRLWRTGPQLPPVHGRRLFRFRNVA